MKIVCFAGVNDTGEAPEKSNISANIRKKIKIVTRFVYWGQEKLFEEKNQIWKIWWHCPFNVVQEMYFQISGWKELSHKIGMD